MPRRKDYLMREDGWYVVSSCYMKRAQTPEEAKELAKIEDALDPITVIRARATTSMPSNLRWLRTARGYAAQRKWIDGLKQIMESEK